MKKKIIILLSCMLLILSGVIRFTKNDKIFAEDQPQVKIKKAIKPKWADFYMALDTEDNLWVWGKKDSGLIFFSDEDVNKPVLVMENVRDIRVQYPSPSVHNVYVLMNNDILYGWGKGGYLGNGTEGGHETPIKIATNVKSLPPETDYDYDGFSYLSNNDELYAWGDNFNGSVGIGVKGPVYEPVKVLDNVKYYSCSSSNIFALTKDNKLYGWGSGGNGQLGGSYHLFVVDTPRLIMSDVVEFGRQFLFVYVKKEDGYFYRSVETRHPYVEFQKMNIEAEHFPTINGWFHGFLDKEGNACLWGATYGENGAPEGEVHDTPETAFNTNLKPILIQADWVEPVYIVDRNNDLYYAGRECPDGFPTSCIVINEYQKIEENIKYINENGNLLIKTDDTLWKRYYDVEKGEYIKEQIIFDRKNAAIVNAPEIISTNLKPGSEISAENEGVYSVQIKFNKGIAKHEGNICIYDYDTNKLIRSIDSSTISLQKDKKTIEFKLEDLNYDKKYYLQIDEGLFASEYGNIAYDGVKDNSWWFTTAKEKLKFPVFLKTKKINKRDAFEVPYGNSNETYAKELQAWLNFYGQTIDLDECKKMLSYKINNLVVDDKTQVYKINDEQSKTVKNIIDDIIVMQNIKSELNKIDTSLEKIKEDDFLDYSKCYENLMNIYSTYNDYNNLNKNKQNLLASTTMLIFNDWLIDKAKETTGALSYMKNLVGLDIDKYDESYRDNPLVNLFTEDTSNFNNYLDKYFSLIKDGKDIAMNVKTVYKDVFVEDSDIMISLKDSGKLVYAVLSGYLNNNMNEQDKEKYPWILDMYKEYKQPIETIYDIFTFSPSNALFFGAKYSQLYIKSVYQCFLDIKEDVAGWYLLANYRLDGDDAQSKKAMFNYDNKKLGIRSFIEYFNHGGNATSKNVVNNKLISLYLNKFSAGYYLTAMPEPEMQFRLANIASELKYLKQYDVNDLSKKLIHFTLAEKNFQETSYKEVVVACPVEIEIYSKQTGKLVGVYSNDLESAPMLEGIQFNLEGEDLKRIFINKDLYTYRLRGISSGVMDVIVMDKQGDELKQYDLYKDISLYEGIVYDLKPDNKLGDKLYHGNNKVNNYYGGTGIPVVKNVILNSKKEIKVKESIPLEYTLHPLDITDKRVTWSVDKPDICQIVNDKIIGVKEGIATLNVKSADGFEKSFTIKVIEEEPVVTEVDKSVLKEAIEKAERLTKEKYTLETWKVFIEALHKAKLVYIDEDATEEDVTNAVKQLIDKTNGLLMKNETAPEEETQKPIQPIAPEEELQKPIQPTDTEEPKDENEPTSPEKEDGKVNTGDVTIPVAYGMLVMVSGTILVVLKKKRI